MQVWDGGVGLAILASPPMIACSRVLTVSLVMANTTQAVHSENSGPSLMRRIMVCMEMVLCGSSY